MKLSVTAGHGSVQDVMLGEIALPNEKHCLEKCLRKSEIDFSIQDYDVNLLEYSRRVDGERKGEGGVSGHVSSERIVLIFSRQCPYDYGTFGTVTDAGAVGGWKA